MTEDIEVNAPRSPASQEEMIRRVEAYVNNETGSVPRTAFGEFAKSLISEDEETSVQLALIQQAAEIYNEVATTNRKVDIFYHFTDRKGAEGIKTSNTLNTDKGNRLFLSKVTPQDAKPLMSEEDTDDLEAIISGNFDVNSLRSKARRHIVSMKFKWRHGIVRRFGNMVPVKPSKLEYVVILAANSSYAHKFDEYGEIYTDKPILREGDPNFYIFGPFRTPEKPK